MSSCYCHNCKEDVMPEMRKGGVVCKECGNRLHESDYSDVDDGNNDEPDKEG